MSLSTLRSRSGLPASKPRRRWRIRPTSTPDIHPTKTRTTPRVRAPTNTIAKWSEPMKIQGSKVLLTGANGGIGRAFIDELLRRGVAKIYAGVRSLDGQSLPRDPRVEPIRLDVT